MNAAATIVLTVFPPVLTLFHLYLDFKLIATKWQVSVLLLWRRFIKCKFLTLNDSVVAAGHNFPFLWRQVCNPFVFDTLHVLLSFDGFHFMLSSRSISIDFLFHMYFLVRASRRQLPPRAHFPAAGGSSYSICPARCATVPPWSRAHFSVSSFAQNRITA